MRATWSSEVKPMVGWMILALVSTSLVRVTEPVLINYRSASSSSRFNLYPNKAPLRTCRCILPWSDELWSCELALLTILLLCIVLVVLAWCYCVCECYCLCYLSRFPSSWCYCKVCYWRYGNVSSFDECGWSRVSAGLLGWLLAKLLCAMLIVNGV